MHALTRIGRLLRACLYLCVAHCFLLPHSIAVLNWFRWCWWWRKSSQRIISTSTTLSLHLSTVSSNSKVWVTKWPQKRRFVRLAERRIRNRLGAIFRKSFSVHDIIKEVAQCKWMKICFLSFPFRYLSLSSWLCRFGICTWTKHSHLKSNIKKRMTQIFFENIILW